MANTTSALKQRGRLSESSHVSGTTDARRKTSEHVASATSERTLQRRYWRLAAVLFIGGGIGAIPSDALHRPEHSPTIYLLPVLALVSGLICVVCADRVPRRWLHLMTAVATLEIALTVWVTKSEVFATYYILIAFYAAYVFRDRRAIAGHFAFA